MIGFTGGASGLTVAGWVVAGFALAGSGLASAPTIVHVPRMASQVIPDCCTFSVGAVLGLASLPIIASRAIFLRASLLFCSACSAVGFLFWSEIACARRRPS